MRVSGALGLILLAALGGSGTGRAGEPAALAKLTCGPADSQGCDPAELFGCDAEDLAVESFEDLVGDEINGSPSFNFSVGFPETLFEFPSGIILAAPDPNTNDLAVADSAVGDAPRYTLGSNGDIFDESMLPSGTAYAARNADSECVGFLLPPSTSECNAVGMYLSSFDGAPVTLTVFDQDGARIGAHSFDTESALGGFIGIVGSPDQRIRSFQLRSEEKFAFDDVWHPVWDGITDPEGDVENPVSCPEPSATTLGFAAVVALTTLSAKRRQTSRRSWLS